MDGVTDIGYRELLLVAADPHRWRILELLGERSRTVGELVQQLDVAQPSVSHHLGRLRSAGFVRVVPEGRTRRYEWAEPVPGSPHSTVWQSLRGWISGAPGTDARRPAFRGDPIPIHLL